MTTDKITAERDAALEEVARLKAERDVLFDALNVLFSEAKNANNVKMTAIDSYRLTMMIELPLNLSNKVNNALAMYSGTKPSDTRTRISLAK